jgi:hypothetical protein
VEAPRSEKYVLVYLLWGKATPTEVSASYAGQIEYTPSPGHDIGVSCMVNCHTKISAYIYLFVVSMF